MQKNYLIKTDFTKDFDKQLESEGWILIESGGTKTIDYNKKFRTYVKEVDLTDVIEMSKTVSKIATEKTEASEISVGACPETPYISTVSATPPNTLWNDCEKEGGCVNTDSISFSHSTTLDESLNGFYMSYPFINEFRTNKQSDDLIIRADYCYLHKENIILSYNLSCILNNKIITILFFPFNNSKLSFNILIGRFLDYLNYIRNPKIIPRKTRLNPAATKSLPGIALHGIIRISAAGLICRDG